MGEDAGESDIGGLHFVRVAFAIAAKEFHELMNEMRVRAAVSPALGEAEVILTAILAIHAAPGERRDLFR